MFEHITVCGMRPPLHQNHGFWDLAPSYSEMGLWRERVGVYNRTKKTHSLDRKVGTQVQHHWLVTALHELLMAQRSQIPSEMSCALRRSLKSGLQVRPGRFAEFSLRREEPAS